MLVESQCMTHLMGENCFFERRIGVQYCIYGDQISCFENVYFLICVFDERIASIYIQCFGSFSKKSIGPYFPC